MDITRQPRKRLGIAASAVFLVSLMTGFILAAHKPLWNDELYTQERSIEGISYAKILAGQIDEGNACPLFYVIQKGVCDLLRYRLPFAWEGQWFIHDLKAQLILRAAPNIYISLTLTLIFYFFTCYYSWRAGGYALVVALSSMSVWGYWAEARPYGLWILLTSAQALILLRIMRPPPLSPRMGRWLTGIHLLLALTTVLGVPQILIGSLLVWFFKVREGQGQESAGVPQRIAILRNYIFLTILPVCLSLFYYVRAPKYKFWFLGSPMALIFENVPWDRMWIFCVYIIFFISLPFLQKRYKMGTRNPGVPLEGGGYLVFLILKILSALALLGWLVFKDEGGPQGFALSSRYFVYLAPVEVIGVTVFSLSLFRAFRGKTWARVNLIIFLGGLLILRLLKTYMGIYQQSMYIHY